MVDPLFVGSKERFEIVKAYQKLKLTPYQGEDTMVRRVVKDMGKYVLNSNNTSTFVSKVIKEYEGRVFEERRERGMS